jgi:hypothetical protein
MDAEIKKAYPRLDFYTKVTRSTHEYLIKPKNKQAEIFFDKAFTLNGKEVTLARKTSGKTTRATIALPVDIPAETIKAPNLLKAVRSSHKEQTAEGQHTVKTKQVTLTFQGQAPNNLKTQYGNFKTRETFVEPLRCYRCQRYGHTQSKCTAAAQCVICAAHHDSDVCLKRPNKKTSTVVPKCVNCTGDHPALSKTCPERLRRLPKAALKAIQDKEEIRKRELEPKKQKEPANKRKPRIPKTQTNILNGNTTSAAVPNRSTEPKQLTPEKSITAVSRQTLPERPSTVKKRTATSAQLTPPGPSTLDKTRKRLLFSEVVDRQLHTARFHADLETKTQRNFSTSSQSTKPEEMEQETSSYQKSVTTILESFTTLLTQQASLLAALSQTFTESCKQHHRTVATLTAQVQNQQVQLQALQHLSNNPQPEDIPATCPSSNGTSTASPQASVPSNRPSQTPSPTSSCSKRHSAPASTPSPSSMDMTSMSTMRSPGTELPPQMKAKGC